MKPDLQSLSDAALLDSVRSLAQREREVTLLVLRHLREVERRSLYAKLSYPSLFEYTVKELKYSEGAAHRRISSMRLLRDLPEVEAKVEAGTLSLSALAQAQTFFRREKEVVKTPEAKLEVVSALEHKSLWEVQRELVSRASEPEKLPAERLRPVSPTLSELKILLDEELLRKIEELRGLLARSKPGATVKDVIVYALGRAVKELRPKAPKTKIHIATRAPSEANSAAAKRQPGRKYRYVPQEVRRVVWRRDRGQCGFRDPMTGRICASRHALEFDHIHPVAWGGKASVENLRLRCRAHNQLAAIAVFGARKMEAFVPRLRSSLPQRK